MPYKYKQLKYLGPSFDPFAYKSSKFCALWAIRTNMYFAKIINFLKTHKNSCIYLNFLVKYRYILSQTPQPPLPSDRQPRPPFIFLSLEKWSELCQWEK